MNGFSDAVSITAISTKKESDEHLLLLHRRICRDSGTLTKKKEPRLEIALVLLFGTIFCDYPLTALSSEPGFSFVR